jgi:hypothetical protein
MLSPVLIARFGQAPTDLVERVVWLEARCRSMRTKGLAGHWTYDKGLHSNLSTVLAAERAALAATEILSASPHRQEARAAA